MKELETVVQDEKNKWILITGILQVLACVIMNKFDISNPNIILFVILSAVLLGETDSLSVMPVRGSGTVWIRSRYALWVYHIHLFYVFLFNGPQFFLF